jgi:hypothetical protein
MRTVIVIFVVIAGCAPGEPRLRYEHECTTPEQAEKLAPWLLKCIEAANPMSDEEPEDWIAQCERTGIKTLCSRVPIVAYQSCRSCAWQYVPCTVITDERLKQVCHQP